MRWFTKMLDCLVDCLVYAYEITKTEYINPPKNIPSSWDSYDTEFGWSREDYRSACGDNSQNTITKVITEMRAYFPETRNDEFIFNGKRDLYGQLPLKDNFFLNGKEYLIKNNFPRAEIVDLETKISLINITGTLLRAGPFSESFVLNQMKKYQ